MALVERFVSAGPLDDGDDTSTSSWIILSHASLDHSLARHLPEAVAREERVVPVARSQVLQVACLEASDALAARLSSFASCPVHLLVSCDPFDIAYGLEAVYGPPGSAAKAREEAIIRNLGRLSYLDPLTLSDVLSRHRADMILADQLLEERLVSDEALAEATALTLHLPYVRLGTWALRTPLVRLLPRVLAETHDLAPIAVYRGRLVVAIACQGSLSALREAARTTGFSIAPVVAPRGAIRSALRIAWGTAPQDDSEKKKHTSSALSLERPFTSLKTGSARQKIDLRVDRKVTGKLPQPLAVRLGGLPIKERGPNVTVAVKEPQSKAVQELYRELLGRPIIEVVLDEESYRTLLGLWPSASVQTPDIIWPPNWWTHEEPFDRFLLSMGYVTSEQADVVRLSIRGQSINTALLIRIGILAEETLVEALGLWLGTPWMQLDQWLPQPDIFHLVPRELAIRHGVVPLLHSGSALLVATTTSNILPTVQKLEKLTGLSVKAVLATRFSIAQALQRCYEEVNGELSEEFMRVTAALGQDGRLTPVQRSCWAEAQLRTNELPDQSAIRLGLFNEEELAPLTATALGLPYQDLTPQERLVGGIDSLGQRVTLRRMYDPVQAATARLLSEEKARSYTAIPLSRGKEWVLVAFAWPSKEDVTALESLLGERIVPVVARRSQIEAAISRRLGRPRIGDTLLDAGLVRPDQLEAAAALAERTGLRLGAALLSLGYLTEVQLAAHLAEQHGLLLLDLEKEQIDLEAAHLVPKEFCSQHQVLPISRSEDELMLAVVDPLNGGVPRKVEELTGLRVRPVLVTRSQYASAYQDLFREDNLQLSASELMARSPEDSASRVLSDGQKAFFLGLLVASVLFFAWNPMGFLIGLVVLVNIFYLTISFYKFYLISKALGYSLEIPITQDEVAALDERDLPMYTILVPLYRETEVLPTLVEAIGRLDYPKGKLDVKLLLEEDDVETIQVARSMRLPAHFQLVIVPNSRPKGKPKACNYGLLHARGSYTVIYDAEDVPDPDQLKKVVLAFRKGNGKLRCIQCKLNYYNKDQNLLTRWFASEYSMWFDLFLPGLNASRAPIPLGGTSNHFPTIVLQELGAWDPYNVTEDADLGIRLFKRGYTTAVIDSTTYEEANSQLYNWTRQRSRWVKGYIQTWLVHMRHPISLYKAVGFNAFFSIQMTVFGTFFVFLVNPIFWALTSIWFLTHWGLIHQMFPGPIFYVGSISLFLGNFIFTYISMMGCLYRGYYSLVKYNLFIVLYWYLMSFAAWKGFLQLFHNPFYWEKTVHGLYKGEVLGKVRNISG